MAKKPRASVTAAAVAAAAVVPAVPSIAASTRSKRKASAVLVKVSVATSIGTTSTSAAVLSTPSSAAYASAISPALKKRRTARAHVNAIPFPALYGSKEVINLYDEDDEETTGDGDGDGDGYRIVDVASPVPTASVSATHTEENTVPVRIVKPDFHVPNEYASHARVLYQCGEYYDAMLTRACVYQHQNEFALLQVLDVPDQGFFLWTRSGLIATTGDTIMEGPWASAHEAIAKFRAVFLSKTLHHWDQRHTQRHDEGSFTWIETQQIMTGEEEAAAAADVKADAAPVVAPRKRRAAKKSRTRAPRKVRPQPLTELIVARATMPTETSPPPSRLHVDVQSFLTMVTDAASAYSSADHRFYSYATTKQPKKPTTTVPDDALLVPIPLGKLTKATIEKGLGALHRLYDALQCHADRTALTHLSSRFYSLVPHPHLTTIDSMVRLTEKVEMLVALSVHGGYQDLVVVPELTQRYFHTNHLDVCYESLECRLVPLPPTSREFGLIQAYMFNSFCCVGNNYGADGKLLTVLRVDKASETTRFHAYRAASNRRVLWHGSRMSNWIGILKHGLLITPPGVPLNGSSLGAGLYFTDKISKAMAYSHASHDRQVFLLSEVALGCCKPSTTGARSGPGPGGSGHATAAATAAATSSTSVHHSCHGMGRCIPDSAGDYVDAVGAIWPLGKATPTKDARATHGHNEFVVYNTAQARMRYVVVTRPLY